METKIVSLLMFAMTAGMTGIALLVLMHHNFSLSRVVIRIDALLSAARMRREQQPIAAALSAEDFKFRFQITDAGGGHACSVTIRALTVHDASAIFRANWPTIENLARLKLTANNRSHIRLEPRSLVRMDSSLVEVAAG